MSKKYKVTKSFTFEGQRYYVRGDTESECEVKKALLIRDLQERKKTVGENTLVKDWTMRCIETYKTGQKEITRKKYISRVNHCILEEIGSMRLKDVRPMHCQMVLNKQTGKSKAQINEIYNALKFIFSKAVVNNLIYKSPAEDIIKPFGTKTSRRAITDYEREHILKVAASDRRYYIYLLMLYCGCRPSEAAEAMGKDIVQIDGYNMLHIRGTKTDSADRVVPLPDALYSIIGSTRKNEHIAQTAQGNPISYDNRGRLWKSFCRQLNLSMGCKTYRNSLLPPYPVAPDLVPYCLRHTYCTDLARNGIDIRMAQKLMGHSDIKLTANIYTNLNNEDVVLAAQILKGCNSGCNTNTV